MRPSNNKGVTFDISSWLLPKPAGPAPLITAHPSCFYLLGFRGWAFAEASSFTELVLASDLKKYLKHLDDCKP